LLGSVGSLWLTSIPAKQYLTDAEGVSNGITGATLNSNGRGITWAEGPDENNWRWTEQWLQHSIWYLLAMIAMTL
jgi:hypothetical protein